MKKALLVFSLFVCAQSVSYAQHRLCGYNLVRKHSTSSGETLAQRHINNIHEVFTTGSHDILVPVVFHIVINSSQLSQIGGTSGMGARVMSQVQVLNEDFNAQNGDSSLIPSVFKSRYGNANIKFALAHTDPNGHSTAGWDIVNTSANGYDVNSFSPCRDAKYGANGGADAWDPQHYLNIWVVNMTSGGQSAGILGITIPPSLTAYPASERGVLVNYDGFGKRNNQSEHYFNLGNGKTADEGRTLTHEIGHYFELKHIWGDTPPGSGNCGDDDGIGDTPQQSDNNYGCPGFPKANCANENGGEMFMNFMDYADDDCLHMFTIGQAGQMFSQLALGGESYPLTEHPEYTLFPVAITNVEKENPFNIAPNPTNGAFELTFASANGTLQSIAVVNTIGQTVYRVAAQTAATNYKVDINGAAKGIYFVQCHFKDGIVTKKIILQ